MFTGIVEETGTIKKIEKGTSSGRLTIEADKVLQGSKIGDSIAVNGVCLTITGMSGHLFTADVMAETIRRSNLGTYRTISSESDLMLAFDCDFFFINNRLIRNRPLIGLSRHTLKISHMSKCILLNSAYLRKVRKNDKYISK